MGVFGWQLVRFSSPKFSSHQPVSPRDAGKWLLVSNFSLCLTHLPFSIVEFASQEDAQRAIRELSEQPLLGRPVFIREVRETILIIVLHLIVLFRIAKTKLASELPPCQVKSGWPWLVKGFMLPHHLALLPIIILEVVLILATNFMSET